MRIVSCPNFVANLADKIDPYREDIHKGELFAIASPLRILGENLEAVLHVTKGTAAKPERALAFDIYSEGYICKTVHTALHTAATVVFGVPMAIFKAGNDALSAAPKTTIATTPTVPTPVTQVIPTSVPVTATVPAVPTATVAIQPEVSTMQSTVVATPATLSPVVEVKASEVPASPSMPKPEDVQAAIVNMMSQINNVLHSQEMVAATR